MTQPLDGDVSRLLTAWSAREPGADERLFSAVYAELRKLAASQRRRESPGHSLQTTALVHEAYLRLNGQRGVTWRNRGHFFAIAAHAMRRILVDHARRRKAAKRAWPPRARVYRSTTPCWRLHNRSIWWSLNAALDNLERVDPRGAKVVELRFFAGLSVPQVAAALGVSRATIEREWTAARAWLRRELNGRPQSHG